MIRGSCLCGGIRFEIRRVLMLHHCHCSKCRRSHGAAFRTAATVAADDFHFVSGSELIEHYRDAPDGYCASFCRVCGSTAPYHSEQYGIVSVPAGLLDDDPGIRPTVHLFVGSKASWWEIRDGAQQFDGSLPGYGPDDEI